MASGVLPSSCRTPFWRALHERGNATAIVAHDANASLSYSALSRRVRAVAMRLALHKPDLILLFADSDIGAIVCYLAALEAGICLLLVPAGLHQSAMEKLIEAYRPELVLTHSSLLGTMSEYCGAQWWEGYRGLRRFQSGGEHPPPDLALILLTSASTGSRKAVRISRRGLAANAIQVAEALQMSARDRTLLNLPLSFVYGLSVVNSSVAVGASLVLTRRRMEERAYWAVLGTYRITALAAVSHTLECMRALRVDAASARTLQRITHSGDAIAAGLCDWMYESFVRCGVYFYLMYGQTEACGRISVLPAAEFPQRRRSVGKAIPGGSIEIAPHGEVTYRGPGVMLGYAAGRADLRAEDALGGVLRTGDVGYLDSAGFLFLTGRISRLCKVLGHRINLDEVEAFLRQEHMAAVIERAGNILVFLEGGEATSSTIVVDLAHRFRIPPQQLKISFVRSLPRGERGKVDYAELRSRA